MAHHWYNQIEDMKKEQEEIYVSPRLRSVDTKTQAMLCDSGGITYMYLDDENVDENGENSDFYL